MEIAKLEECKELCHDITSHLFEEWQTDYETLTEWKTREKLEKFYHDTIANTTQSIPTAFVAYHTDPNDPSKKQFTGISVITNDDMEMRPDLSPWLAAVYVRPEMRKRGIAGQLIRSALEYAQSNLKLEKIYLWTFDAAFAEYYKLFGFNVIQVKQKHGDRENVYVMERILK